MTCSTFLPMSLLLLLLLLLSSYKTAASDVNQDESQGNHKRHGISNSFTERVLQQNYDKILRPYSFQGTYTHTNIMVSSPTPTRNEECNPKTLDFEFVLSRDNKTATINQLTRTQRVFVFLMNLILFCFQELHSM